MSVTSSTAGLSPSLIQRIKKLWGDLDSDQSGSISTKEVGALMAKFGIKLSEHQIANLVKRVDADNSGEVEYDEFIVLVKLALGITDPTPAPVVPVPAPVVPEVKSRSFPAPAAAAPIAPVPAPVVPPVVDLAVTFVNNTAASSNVGINGTKITSFIPLGPTAYPFSFVVDTALVGATYKIVLVSQLNASAWGRWAGVTTNRNLSQFHIVGNNSADEGSAQISTLGVKTGGVWKYKVPNYVEPSGGVQLILEYQTGGNLVASWNGAQLPFGVSNIPSGVYFTFEVPNSLEVTVTSFQKLTSPTLTAVPSLYSW